MARIHQEIADTEKGDGAGGGVPFDQEYYTMYSTGHLPLAPMPVKIKGIPRGGAIFCAQTADVLPAGLVAHLVKADPDLFAEQDNILFDTRWRQDPITPTTCPEWIGSMSVLEVFLQPKMMLPNYHPYRTNLISNEVNALLQQVRCLTPTA